MLLIVFLCSIFSCVILKDDPLSLDREANSGTDIRLDGYWWQKLKLAHEPHVGIYFFYKDGVFLQGGAISIAELDEYDFSSDEFRKASLRSKTGWGVFQTSQSTIQIETWLASSGGRLKTGIKTGEIINNEMFVIYSSLNNYSGETSARNDTFYFKEFSPKPDSTNTFIK